MFRSLPVVACFGIALSACSSGSDSGSSPAGAGAPASTVFGIAANSGLDLTTKTASLETGTANLVKYGQDIAVRAVNDAGSGPIRRFRYGKPQTTYHPNRNYTVPLTVTNAGGQLTGTGTATFSGADVESGVTSRTLTVTDVELTRSLFGLLWSADSGSRGDFFEVHAYSTGVNPSAPQAGATYTGTFVGDVISEGTSATTRRLDLAANLTIDATGGTVTGTLGPSGSPDIALNGSVTGAQMSGSAVVSSTGVTLANGSAGSFDGGFFGAGGLEATGSVGIIDTSGATRHDLVGAFGATRN